MEGFPFFDAATGSLGRASPSPPAWARPPASTGSTSDLLHHRRWRGARGPDRRGDRLHRRSQAPQRAAHLQLQRLRPGRPRQPAAVRREPRSPSSRPPASTSRSSTGTTPHRSRAPSTRSSRSMPRPAKPMAVVAKTVKGWGCPSIQGNGWHGKPPTGDALKRPSPSSTNAASNSPAPSPPPTSSRSSPPPSQGARRDPRRPPTLSRVHEEERHGVLLQAGTMATRRAYGIALRALGSVNEDRRPRRRRLQLHLRRDVQEGPGVPDRFMECKIAEQNMFSVGAGLVRGRQGPLLLHLRQVRHPRVRPDRDGHLQRREPQGRRQPRGHHPRRRRPQPDVPPRRRLVPLLHHHADHRGNPGCYVLQPADAFAAYALTR
jgi:hypothetical protein